MLHEEDARRLALAILGQAYFDFQHVYKGIRRQQEACVCGCSVKPRTYKSLSGHTTFPLLDPQERSLLDFWKNKDGVLENYLDLAGLLRSPISETQIRICEDYRINCLPCLISHRRGSHASE